MTAHMHRRSFLTLLGGTAAAWPLAARAQQAARARRIGYLGTSVPGNPVAQPRVDAFLRGLRELGWVDGQNLHMEYRWGQNDLSRARAYATELTRLDLEAIFVAGTANLAVMRDATSTIPIVFADVTDPVSLGFVKSLAKPGGNITGFAQFEFSFATKMLQILAEAAPGLTHAVMVYDPNNPSWRGYRAELERAASAFKIGVWSVPMQDESGLEQALPPDTSNLGMVVFAGPRTTEYLDTIVALAARRRLPTIYQFQYFVEGGGLMSYGIDDRDSCWRAASYVDSILKGEKPGDLPVQQAIKVALVINLKTAKAQGFTIPNTILALADEVIE